MTDFKWYLVQSKPGQSERAAQELEKQGYEVFFPTIEVEKIKKGHRVKQTEPMFPGYVFIELSELSSNWRPIRSTRGVARMVSFGNKPAEVPDDVVEQLRTHVRSRPAKSSLTSNHPVSLEDGPFKHLNAIFIEYDGDQRAFLLLELLGKWQRLSVPLEHIRGV
ncbi:transcription/translation regulatory transformer protein RfaH [Idiomarina abyssalis]|uniref:transcription/translation regulatory transformer protein RfaH n=1 Tax=Idiomarina abyssalis TaxID=86102 RepID=UPI003A93D7E3